jgi:hypothetical protein
MRWRRRIRLRLRLKLLMWKLQKLNLLDKATFNLHKKRATRLLGWRPKTENGNALKRHVHHRNLRLLREDIDQHLQPTLSRHLRRTIIPQPTEMTYWRTTDSQTNQHSQDNLRKQQGNKDDTPGTHHPATSHLASEPFSLAQMPVPNTPQQRMDTHPLQST